ncbi:MAG: sec-independent protein translocase protein TatA [Frankiaceae bacterium]|jgi:sec-independent protein translocase protein TatA|nr:sec-independent protein translocase protein TatA [Frankiaceae bacterium]
MGELSWWHWLIVVLVFVLLFGSKRLPDAARALGKSMRILKTEVKGLHDDDDPDSATQPAAPAAIAPATAPPAVAPEPAATAASDPSDPR